MENSYYRASAALATDLRDFQVRRRQYVTDYVDPYVAEFPNNSPWFILISEEVVGFTDEAPHLPPPEGLSRSSRRQYLIPARGKAGTLWRERLKMFNSKLPKSSDVWRKHDVRRYVLRGDTIYITHCADFGGDDAIVITGGVFDPVPAALTPLRASEFHLVKEAYEEAHPTDWRERLKGFA